MISEDSTPGYSVRDQTEVAAISDDDFTEALVYPGDVGVRAAFADPVVQRLWMAESPTPLTEELAAHLRTAWDLEAWASYLERWRYRGRNPTIELSIEAEWPAFPNLRADVSGWDTQRGREHLWTNNVRRVGLPTRKPVRGTARWLRAIIRWCVAHEVDELICVDGRHPFNPHRGKPTAGGEAIRGTTHAEMFREDIQRDHWPKVGRDDG